MRASSLALSLTGQIDYYFSLKKPEKYQSRVNDESPESLHKKEFQAQDNLISRLVLLKEIDRQTLQLLRQDSQQVLSLPLQKDIEQLRLPSW